MKKTTKSINEENERPKWNQVAWSPSNWKEKTKYMAHKYWKIMAKKEGDSHSP